MKFVDGIWQFFADIGELVYGGINAILEFLSKPLSWLFWFLDGIFYFITVLFDIVVNIIMIFVALFQFIIALITGLFRTLQVLLTPNFSSPVNMPSNSQQGFDVVVDVVDPTGILNIVPYICLAVVWIFFIFKILGLFSGQSAKGGS